MATRVRLVTDKGSDDMAALVGGGSCQAMAGACWVRPLSASRADLLSLTVGRRWRVALAPTLTVCDLVIMIMGQLASFGLPWWRRAGRQARSGVTFAGPP
jgi:hypothetical protein